jgi:surfeit locus 1 family protein
MALVGIAALASLGTWQLQRKAWKEEILARIEQRTQAAPVSFEAAIAEAQRSADVEYRRVRVRGRFRHEDERHFYAPDQRLGPGLHVYTPLETTDGTVVFVNRGFVPEALRDPAKRDDGQAAGEVEVTGLVRLPSAKGAFTPANRPERNLWFWRDLDALYASLAKNESTRRAPFVIDAEAEPQNHGGWPRGGTTVLRVPNRHLEYALTWYGLAGTLVVVYVVFAAGRLRQRAG